jgi:hypothetical protein
METVKETKMNGKTKVKKEAPKTKSVAKSVKAGKITGWTIAREMLGAGKGEKEIRAAIHDHLAKITDPKTAMGFYIQRMSYRMLFRAKRAAKAAKKEKK